MLAETQEITNSTFQVPVSNVHGAHKLGHLTYCLFHNCPLLYSQNLRYETSNERGGFRSCQQGTLAVQLGKIRLVALLDDLPLELEGRRDEARFWGPWLRYQLDPGWNLKLLQSRLLTSLY